ncbi:catechol O-methyltransferase [Sclerotinia borealis F-4128]|uniref:catechol O-methyltransferase n=1 Tax=Sclerotinia borealis (strain F-4128) TaxID=1432307 RepID=W9CF68_SCLBF|nr:catechol O-methyltransferase [Sclerotinia borealis F-4128]
MAQFDQAKSYASQEETFFDDGREEELVEFVRNHPDRSRIQGSPAKVLQAIDEYGRTKRYLMNVGEDKGAIVTNIIKENNPQVMVELGGYCGYSTILFGSAVRAAGGKKYYSLERSPKFAKVITTLVEFAGLDGFVEVIVGPSNEGIQILHSKGLKSIDMMFLDHYKPAYTTDLKLCEQLGLINKGTVLAADNVISPGNPPYLEYVRSSVEEKLQKLKLEGKLDTDNFAKRSATQYGDVEALNTELKGNPSIIYESQLINSFEPTGEPDGVEITRCMGDIEGSRSGT